MPHKYLFFNNFNFNFFNWGGIVSLDTRGDYDDAAKHGCDGEHCYSRGDGRTMPWRYDDVNNDFVEVLD